VVIDIALPFRGTILGGTGSFLKVLMEPSMLDKPYVEKREPDRSAAGH
jgi:hypothetical protein